MHDTELEDLIGTYSRNAYARDAAIRDAVSIARSLGLRRIRNLTVNDLYDLTDAADTSSLTTNQLYSFHRADLVMEGTDARGEICYVAAEISFTANGRDTDRAIRNARFLEEITGGTLTRLLPGCDWPTASSRALMLERLPGTSWTPPTWKQSSPPEFRPASALGSVAI